jgi:hypothetical protein
MKNGILSQMMPFFITDIQLNITGLRLAPFKGINSIGVSLPSPEDTNRSSFLNVVFSSYLEYWMISPETL